MNKEEKTVATNRAASDQIFTPAFYQHTKATSVKKPYIKHS